MEKKAVIYQEGNTLRTDTVLVPTREEEILGLPEREEERRVSRKAAPAPRVSAAHVVMLMLLSSLTVVFAVLCVSFLSLNAQITASREKIYELENALMEARTANDMTQARLNAQTDLNEVYRIATIQLGMVYPDGNEQISYESQVREYVRQHEDIPGDGRQ